MEYERSSRACPEPGEGAGRRARNLPLRRNPGHTLLATVTHAPEQTQALGRRLGEAAQPGDLVLLVGELGTGKTCLTQGIAQGLGIEAYVRSPTFVLATEYRGRLMLYHIDLYRIDDPREAQDLGLDEYVEGEGVCVVEWADKALPIFPAEHLQVELRHQGPQARGLRFTAHGHRHAQLLDSIRKYVKEVKANP